MRKNQDVITRADAVANLKKCIEIPASLLVIAIGAVNRTKAATDVVHVTRCEKCTHHCHGFCKLLKIKIDPHDFCSYGKAAEDAQT